MVWQICNLKKQNPKTFLSDFCSKALMWVEEQNRAKTPGSVTAPQPAELTAPDIKCDLYDQQHLSLQEAGSRRGVFCNAMGEEKSTWKQMPMGMTFKTVPMTCLFLG